jgi:hypothetical protein
LLVKLLVLPLVLLVVVAACCCALGVVAVAGDTVHIVLAVLVLG